MNPFGKAHEDLDPPEVLRTGYTLKEPPADIDPVTFEIVKHRLWYVVLTIGETLKKVSGTTTSAEANDLSTYVTLEDGAPVFLGPYIMLHSGIADLVVENTIRLNREDPGIYDGDMFFCNDAWLGPVHQCDVAIVAPLFIEDEIFSWSGVTLHQLDMGGVDPGGLCPNARDAFAEPNMYPCIKIVERGKLRADIDRLIRRNSRMPGIVALDIRSMIAANNAARRDLLQLIDRYGPECVKSVMIMIQNRSNEAFKRRLKSLPRGKFRVRDFYEIGGAAPELQDEVYEMQLTMTNTGEKLIFDYTGTSKQSTGFANCGIGGLRSGVLTGILEQLCSDISWNAGILINIEFITQQGTVNNPLFPAAVSDGITEGAISTSCAAAMAVANMGLADEHMKRTSIATSGAQVFLGNTLVGVTPSGEMWGTLLMDGICMCYSANAARDGLDVSGTGGIPYTQCANVETNELHYPLLYLFRRMGRQSGGAGTMRGGNSIELAFTPYNTFYMLMLLWTHGAEFPNAVGFGGGLSAAAVRFKLSQTSDLQEMFERGYIPQSMDEFECTPLAAKSESHLAPWNVIYFGVSGTGGFGDPLAREPGKVAEDVRAGSYSREFAKKFYCVELNPATGESEETATRDLRGAAIQQRLSRSAYPHEWQKFEPDGKADATSSSPLSAAPEPEPPLQTLLELGLALKIVRDSNGSTFWTCSGCDHVFCAAADSPKLHAKMNIGPINDLSHPSGQMTRLDAPRFFFRHFYCPSCGSAFDCEVARPDDPIIHSVEYDPDWLRAVEAMDREEAP